MQSISRILFFENKEMVISLDLALLTGSSGLPGKTGAGNSNALSLFGLAPCGVYPALTVSCQAVSSYLAISPLPAEAGGIFSVALSLFHSFPYETLPVRKRTALRSSDFPPVSTSETGDHRSALVAILAFYEEKSQESKLFHYSTVSPVIPEEWQTIEMLLKLSNLFFIVRETTFVP